MTEAYLSAYRLSMGHSPGTSCCAAVEFAENAPWMAVFPRLAISLGVFAFHLFGDALAPKLWVL